MAEDNFLSNFLTGTPVAYDRFLKTPITYKEGMINSSGAAGRYDEPNFIFNPTGKITLDNQLQINPKTPPFMSLWNQRTDNPEGDSADILRHEIIHAGSNKYKVDPTLIKYGNDKQGLDLKDWITQALASSGPDEHITTPLSSKKGEYMPRVPLNPEQVKYYQKYLLNSIANSPNIHPGFKILLRRLGYGI